MKFTTLLLLAAMLMMTFTIISAQEAWTNVTSVQCTNADTIDYTPAQGAIAFCGASNNIPCQDAITMGYPNAFGSLSGADVRGPFTFNQQLTSNPLYVVISDFQGRPAYKTRFFLQVDRYSLLELGGTAGNEDIDVGLFMDNQPIDADSAMKMNNTLIQVEFAGFTVPAVRRTLIPPPEVIDVEPVTNSVRRVVSFYTLIIELDRGMISKMFWQTGCFGCGDSSNCWKESTNKQQWCTNTFNLCSVVDAAATGGLSCNIKIYVAWQGTDVKGNYLMSAQTTIKNFLQFSFNTPFETAQNVFDTLSPGANDGF